MDESAHTASIDPMLVLLVVAVLVAIAIPIMLLRRRRENVTIEYENPPPPRRRALSVGNAPELMALINDGQLINAIKLVRERSGLGLKEAKDYVDRLR